MAQHQVVTVKVEAFRNFVQVLFSQVGEQMCAEFEREVAMLTDDVATYRTELARCGELLAMQLGREKQLHGMLEQIAGNSGTLVGNVADIGKSHEELHSNKQNMHDMVEKMFGHSTMAIQSTVQGVSEAHSVTHSHLAQAKELQNQALTAENELNRIMSLLTQAPVMMGQVGPTVARMPDYKLAAPMYPGLGSAPALQTSSIMQPAPMGMGPGMMPLPMTRPGSVGTPPGQGYGGVSPIRSPLAGANKSPSLRMGGGGDVFGGQAFA